MGPYPEGLAPVKIGDKWEFITQDQDVIIPAKYDKVGQSFSGLAVVRLQNGH